jgi:hypothetical protein
VRTRAVLDHTPQGGHALTRIVNAGLLTDIEVDRFLDLTRQPGFGSMPLPVVTARGQRRASWATEVEIGLLVPAMPQRVERSASVAAPDVETRPNTEI